jgi:hypothetical protein
VSGADQEFDDLPSEFQAELLRYYDNQSRWRRMFRRLGRGVRDFARQVGSAVVSGGAGQVATRILALG